MKHSYSNKSCSACGDLDGCHLANGRNELVSDYENSLALIPRCFGLSDIVYLSGPMSGIKDFNRPIFNLVKKRVAHLTGATVISPADIPEHPSWEHQIRRCVRFIPDCTKILMLPGWESSKGALLEHLIACQVLMPRFYLEDNLMRASRVTMVKLDVTFMTRFMDEKLSHNTAEELA